MAGLRQGRGRLDIRSPLRSKGRLASWESRRARWDHDPKGFVSLEADSHCRPSRSGDLLTISLTLNSAPTAAKAVACSGNTASGGRWGAEFWAAAGGIDGGTEGGNNFYVAYRDNPLENGGIPGVEAGYIDNVNATVTTLEFRPKTGVTGTLGGTCFTAAGVPTTTMPCTVTMTIPLSSLSITPGNGLYSITGLASAALLQGEKLPGVWAVFTGWNPEPVILHGVAQENRSSSTTPVCAAVALALVPPRPGMPGLQLRIEPSVRQGYHAPDEVETADMSPFRLAAMDLAAGERPIDDAGISSVRSFELPITRLRGATCALTPCPVCGLATRGPCCR